MTKHNKIQIFSDQKVRTVWDSETEKWYFSVVDVVAVLTDSENPRRYLSDLKRKLTKEGSELYDNIVQLKPPAADGKMRMTDVADQQQLFRLIQSIPSPKAEPFKQWMAQVASNRIYHGNFQATEPSQHRTPHRHRKKRRKCGQGGEERARSPFGTQCDFIRKSKRLLDWQRPKERRIRH